MVKRYIVKVVDKKTKTVCPLKLGFLCLFFTVIV